MIFTLEALRAKHGDSLILHFGDAQAPQFVVIDGGANGVYRDAFRPRLDALAQRWPVDGQLRIEALVISHLDEDHIRGVLDLTDKLIETQATKGLPFHVRTLWHNAFDDIVGDKAAELASTIAEAPARIAAAEGPAPPFAGESTAVVASVGQGRRLRDNARKLGWAPNAQFSGGLIVAPADGVRKEFFGPLELTVIGPLKAEVEKLQVDWDKELKKLGVAKQAEEAARIAEYLDDSVYNLSSIVLMAELGGKRMLLTGDARGDLILDGLEGAGLLGADEPLFVDILKLPHHGSDRNVEPDFFERIHARHYVASGDGKHDNPSPATFEMITQARLDDDFTIHLTYGTFKGVIEAQITDRFAADKAAGRRYEVIRREDAALSVSVDLLEEVTY